MARTVGSDGLVYSRCGGRLRLIALIEGTAGIERTLRQLGVPTAIPRRVGIPDQAGWDDDTSVFTPCS